MLKASSLSLLAFVRIYTTLLYGVRFNQQDVTDSVDYARFGVRFANRFSANRPIYERAA